MTLVPTGTSVFDSPANAITPGACMGLTRATDAKCWVIEPSGNVSSTRKRAASQWGFSLGIGNDETAFAKTKYGESNVADKDERPPRSGMASDALIRNWTDMMNGWFWPTVAVTATDATGKKPS
ncbi:hypothetical protein M0765_018990 [Variovorax sp. S2]|uniref:hypothetical protein n=1 Tax=Variovorax sp. S12S4 TaxID=3029170 RepID=UPI00215D1423|nr:hypothetical protein [Variovorax sp. S12S4]MCR8959749.1 hypothetical protein [Variovorax sp. S12S4]